jgi:ParB family chromosome partitioning protein
MLDLSALGSIATPSSVSAAQSSGAPLDIHLGLIDEDVDQPRRAFDNESLQELAKSIQSKGVKSPISVRQNPQDTDRWILNYGARRLRASLLAGKKTIPAFVDESHDSYDQVIENLQRDDLKPIELALFVQKRIDAGDKKKDIANSLGKSANFITEHLALIDMPQNIESLFRLGRLTSPKTVLELRKLWDKKPEFVESAIEEWIESGDDVTRGQVEALAERLKAPNAPQAKASEPAPATDGFPDSEHDIDNKETGMDGENAETSVLPFHNPNIEAEIKEPRLSDSDKIKKPLLLATYKKDGVMVLLNKRPFKEGLIWIRYEDGSGEEQVDAAFLKISLLTEKQD